MPALRFRTDFGVLLMRYLAEARMSQRDLAKTMKITPARVNRVACARVTVTQAWVDRVASALHLTEEQRGKLHVEAARLREEPL